MLDRLTALLSRRPETAEAWLARLARPDIGARDQADFLAWLEAAPDHLDQYERAKADLAAMEGLRGALAGDLERLRGRRPVARPSRPLLAGAGVLAACVAVVATVLALNLAPPEQLYESGPGQIVDVALDDGSQVTLDAGSAIRVSLGDDARRVTLERGAAYFDVAHAPTRPFQVAVADRRVIVTGTRFVTTLTPDGGKVSLLEGRVRLGKKDVGSRDALSTALAMTPGDQIVFRTGGDAVRRPAADLEAETAWRGRRLVFLNAPLSQVVAEASRYSAIPLQVADPALGDIRVTVVLPLEGQGALHDRMAALLPIRFQPADGRLLVRAD